MKLSSRFGPIALGLAFAFGLCSPAEATSITIQNVTLTSTIGTDVRTWCMVGCVPNQGAGDIWAGFTNTVVNSPSSGGTQALVLTQNPTATVPGFNFDTSEHTFNNGTSTSCNAANPCTMALTILTNLFGLVSVPLSSGNALNAGNVDQGGVFQEAANWNASVLNTPGGLHVWIGYADNAHDDPTHTTPCADTAGTIAGNCLPDNPWQGSPNTVFAGQAVPGTSTECLRTGITSCFDAGAIRIELNDPVQTVPEPATMTLLATGFAGLAARRYRQAQKRRNGHPTD